MKRTMSLLALAGTILITSQVLGTAASAKPAKTAAACSIEDCSSSCPMPCGQECPLPCAGNDAAEATTTMEIGE